ncbi:MULTISPECIES: helix-turn-helix transcriptional regulator [Pontibacillus]|uniref:Helix-turn-helix transcriptional regulator n=1 Tax=Pontibacillus chungwhensis TaxID=265426 RepID=A0ABY8UV36_9BACI|nr:MULTISPECIES: helix-turn-helix transcriptional regulator [Pontibacillus]MCD5325088.1 helix-turn-helix transcriptional regulator [Pontibacillus sp. HN14]WIF97339.1 helix-turn-helix transcriptional regulator [Pontibacillus chungwhensis]
MKNLIREKRTEKKITQEDLSIQLQVSRQTVISLEKGKYKPSLILAHKLAQVFDCSIEDLFIFEGEENIQST